MFISKIDNGYDLRYVIEQTINKLLTIVSQNAENKRDLRLFECFQLGTYIIGIQRPYWVNPTESRVAEFGNEYKKIIKELKKLVALLFFC